MEHQPKSSQFELATSHEVGKLNAYASHLVELYGSSPLPRVYGRIENAVFSLKNAEGELRIRRILPTPQSDETESLIRLELVQPELHDALDIISIETEGNNPSGVESYRAKLMLSSDSSIDNFTESFEAHSLAMSDPDAAIMLFGKIDNRHKADFEPVSYTHELHEHIMQALRNIDKAYTSPIHGKK